MQKKKNLFSAKVSIKENLGTLKFSPQESPPPPCLRFCNFPMTEKKGSTKPPLCPRATTG